MERKNKCTLLIDGNWLMMSRLFANPSKFNTSLPEKILEQSRHDLTDQLAKSTNIILRKMPYIDNIILVTDGGSWRKQLSTPSCLEDITYKGNREKEKSEDISWSHVFGALSDFSESCKKAGLTVSHQYDIEGDDWIWYWSRVLNEQGINCIIWSIDNDLRQLVNHKGDAVTAWYCERNNKVSISLHSSLMDAPVDMDNLEFFLLPPVCKPDIVKELEKTTQSIIYTDPSDVILSKIICGDHGDNIKSIVRALSKGRVYGIGEKSWDKMRKQLNINNVHDLQIKTDDLINEIRKIDKFSNVSVNNIKEMIDYNTKLVWLNEEVIPNTIIDAMNQSEYLVCDIDYIRGAYTTLLNNQNEAEKVFEDIDIPF